VWVLAVVAIGWLLVLGTRFLVPALLPEIRADFGVSNAAAGAALTLLWGVYALTQFPAGVFVDRVGERRLLLVSLLAGSTGALAFATSAGFPGFLVACVLFGTGTGLYIPPVTTLLTERFPDAGGTALGVTLAAGSVGATVLPLTGAALAVRHDWRLGIGFVVPLLATAAVGVRLVVPPGEHDPTGSLDRSRHRARQFVVEVFGKRQVRLSVVGITVLTFTHQGLVTFMPTYLVAVKRPQPTTAATLFGLLFASGAVIQPVAGRVADVLGRRRTLAGLTAFSVLPLGALPFAHGTPSIGVLVVLIGLRVGVTPVNDSYVIDSLPARVRGSGYGLLRSVTLLLSATGSLAVGVVADGGLFDAAFLGLAGLTGVAALAYARLPAGGPGPGPRPGE
jgi:predicted MFS family arabinose efflux permease